MPIPFPFQEMRSLLVALTYLAAVHAQYQSLFSQMIYQGIAATGPLQLADVFPLYWHRERPNTDERALCKNSAGVTDPIIHKSWSAGRTLANEVPVYIIYYGTGHTATQKSLIENFVRNIGNTPYWGVVQTYVNSAGTRAGIPSVKGVYNVTCSTSSTCSVWNGCYPCSFNQWQEQGILQTFLAQNPTIQNIDAVFMFLSGTNVNYSFTQGVTSPIILGDSSVCGYRDSAMIGPPTGYPYIWVPLLKSPNSPCNLGKHLPGGYFPNADYQVDNLIPVILHELAETIISTVPPGGGSAFLDACSREAADKCGNQYVNVAGDNANIIVNGSRYTVFPLWHYTKKLCSMGDTATSIPNLPAPSGYCTKCRVYSLLSGSTLHSNGSNTLVGYGHRFVVQANGDVALFDNAATGGSRLWGTGTLTTDASYRLGMQSDGNLVLYDSANVARWSSNTGGRAIGNYCVKLVSSGSLEIMDSSCNVIWTRAP